MAKGPLQEFTLLLTLPAQALQLHLHSRELLTPIVGLSRWLMDWLRDHRQLSYHWSRCCWHW